ncbi:MAG: glycosyltransferase family 4 protein [Sterolibacterium sp.]|nr:glycosyltransferase family 4 protein [Sterolibacterium sp.]
MARIAVLVSNPCTGDARVIKMAHAAVSNGHEVHVFATAGANASPYEEVAGVIYHRIEWRPAALLAGWSPLAWLMRLHRPSIAALLKRITPFLKYRLFSQVFCEHVVAIKPDIVHAHDLICLPAGFNAKRETGARLIYDAHELETHRNPPLPFFQKYFVGLVEAKYAQRADAINTVGMLVGQELAAHIKRNDINILYNSPPLDDCPRNIRTDLQLDEETQLLIYVGKVTEGRGVGQILELLPKMPGVIFATIGPCDLKSHSKLKSHSERLGVSSRFRILPPVPFEQVVSYIKGADLGVISVEPVTLSYRYCMPNKLFELSFANVPIISNKLDEIEGYLAELGNGEIADFENKAALAYTMFRMLQEKQRYLMGADALAVLQQKYSWESQSKKLLKSYDLILAKRPQ